MTLSFSSYKVVNEAAVTISDYIYLYYIKMKNFHCYFNSNVQLFLVGSFQWPTYESHTLL